MPIVIPAPGIGTDPESFELDGLQLNDTVTLSLASAVHVPAAKKPEWTAGDDSQGALLARDPLHDNCTWELRLQIEPQATMNAALAHIAAIEDKLQECSKHERGLPLVWDPANSSLPPITWRALLGEITDRPIDHENGWFAQAPTLGIRLTCLPFGEGEEFLAATVTSDAPIVELDVDAIPGAVAATGRLVVTDAAAKARRYCAWGLESRHYDPGTPLIVDSSSMITAGYIGTTAVQSGSYGGTVIAANARTRSQAICGLGNLAHIGRFRPHLRIHASAPTIALRLVWQALDGPLRSLSYKVPVQTGWNHVDLGSINVPSAQSGTQRWTGRIEAFSTAAGGEALLIDAMWLIPAERFGRARSSYAYGPGVLTAADEFTSITAGTSLNARAAPVGGSWATGGGATDFAAFDDPVTGEESMQRNAVDSGYHTGMRWAVLGSTDYTDIEVGSLIQLRAVNVIANQAITARWGDVNNYLALRVLPAGGPFGTNTGAVHLEARVAGTIVATTSALFPRTVGAWLAVRLIAYAGGRAIGSVLNSSGATIATVELVHPALAPGGALEEGKPGMFDFCGSGLGPRRTYRDFYAAAPMPEPIVCHPGRSIEFRSDAAVREDATGNFAGPPPEYVGSRFIVPCGGDPGRTSRIAVLARRNDVEVVNDDELVGGAAMDATTVEVFATPRYLTVPR